jgi:trehalose 6-phosphate phosphatase
MAIETIATQIVEVLGHRPAGLFSDFDGVLSEIAPTPDGAVAYPGAAEALATIATRVDVTGVISGRAVDDVASRIPSSSLTVVGNHGLEWWEKGVRRDHEAGTAAIESIARVMDAAKSELAILTDDTRLIWENKRLSGTIHFRNVDDPAAMEQLILPIVQPLAEAHGLRCTAGKMIVELRPLAHVTKGTALNEIIESNGLASAVFIGDDVTDVDGFRALHELRSVGKHTLAVGVVAADVHPDVAAYSDVHVTSVSDIVEVLTLVGQTLESR